MRPSTIRDLLALGLPRQHYEVLPLESERFHPIRTNLEALFRDAKREGCRVVTRYPDARLCVVVFSVDKVCRNSPEVVQFDYAMVVRHDRRCHHTLLNPPVPNNDKLYWASSPTLQPEFAEKVIELSEVEFLR